MEPAQIHLISSTFPAISPQIPALAVVFYDELFKRAPGVRAIFPNDMTRQKQHLATAVAIVGRNIDALDAIERPLMEMGERHVSYGAAPEHYPVVRDTLLEAMAQVYGPALTPELREAWFAALNEVAAIMLRGAALAAIRKLGGLVGGEGVEPTAKAG